MEIKEIIKLNERNIRQALEDYGRHTIRRGVLNDVTGDFVQTLAADSAYSKRELRELFKKSPAWDEELQALVINGTRTHDPDPYRIISLVFEILEPGYYGENTQLTPTMKSRIADFFASAGASQSGLDVIKEIAPKAYAPGKKYSRIFKSLCDTLHVSDDTAGSAFQRLYAQFADELSAKKIEFKLYVSINPAHFLTMSNPKGDRRGSTLTSCHSFNSIEYAYNCGCSGYARDENTFIVFTAADPNDPETLNNRKTTRQIFAYKPGNGVLLQSRLYNTFGGTNGSQTESALYRDLIQREISDLEGAPNLWKTYPYFDGKISIRADRKTDYKPIYIGTYGLCVCCGHETSKGVYCDDCCEGYICDCCEERFFEYELYTVYDENDETIRVCERCRDENYSYCNECGEYFLNNWAAWVGDTCVCDGCFNEYYEQCGHCGEYERRSNMHDAVNEDGHDIRICEACADEEYAPCHECGRYVQNENVSAIAENGEYILVCPECYRAKTSKEVAV